MQLRYAPGLRDPQVIADIDRLMRRSDQRTPQSIESLFKAAITSTERDLRRPEMPAPTLHLWTATGYRAFQGDDDSFSIHPKSLPQVWDNVLPALVADTRSTRLAQGQVLFLPASMYRPDAEEGYGAYTALVVALDAHGFHRRAQCSIVPDGERFKRVSAWVATYPDPEGYAGALDDPRRVIEALSQQERPLAVPGLVEVLGS